MKEIDMPVSSRLLMRVAGILSMCVCFTVDGQSWHARAIDRWAERWQGASCASWEWTYTLNEGLSSTQSAETTERITSCWPVALSRSLVLAPERTDVSVIGINQIEGFADASRWFRIDRNTDTYTVSSYADKNEARLRLLAGFVGSAPTILSSMLNSGAVRAVEEEIEPSAGGHGFVWTPSGLPAIRATFAATDDDTARLESIIHSSRPSSETVYVYTYDGHSAYPVQIERRSTVDPDALGRVLGEQVPPGFDPVQNTVMLRTGLDLGLSPETQLLDVSGITGYDEETGRVYDGEGNVIREFEPISRPGTGRRWFAIFLFVGLGSLALAAAVFIVKRLAR
ncbi:MAG: hypothetical protein AAGF47_07125 [Planctomycetota bacterium]